MLSVPYSLPLKCVKYGRKAGYSRECDEWWNTYRRMVQGTVRPNKAKHTQQSQKKDRGINL